MAKKKLPKPPVAFAFGPGTPLIHIGRKAPKGYVELSGAMHLGKGIWVIPIAPEPETKEAPIS